MTTKAKLEEYTVEYGRRPYWLSVLISVDQLANALLWGYVDETLSSRAHRSASQGKTRWVVAEKVINTIFFWEEEHCENAYLAEVMREHLPRKF